MAFQKDFRARTLILGIIFISKLRTHILVLSGLQNVTELNRRSFNRCVVGKPAEIMGADNDPRSFGG